MPVRRNPSLIAVANEQVPIAVACRMAGVSVVGDAGRPTKVHCPFGALHSDGGIDKAMRVYTDTNSAWCFSCTTFYTPVKIFAQARELDYRTAATVLLDHIGYRPLSLADQFAAAERSAQPDTAQLADALKIYCQRVIPGWRGRQYNADESALLARCLALLDRVRSDTEAQLWLNTTKSIMARNFAGTSCS